MDSVSAPSREGIRLNHAATSFRSSSAHRQKRPAILAASIAGFLALCLAPQEARSQTWVGGTSGDWNTASNWNPATVPNSVPATATFGASGTTAVSISQITQVSSLTFTSGATSPYTLTITPITGLYIWGAGVTNNSGVVQNIETAADASKNFGRIFFSNGASAGSQVQYTNDGAVVSGGLGGSIEFYSTSTASSATIINQGSTVSGGSGGSTTFDGASTAGSATITTNGGSNGGGGGATYFNTGADGGTARAITNGNGVFDISQLTDGGMKIGSIEGSGTYDLGGNSLTVGGNNLSTTVSGVIADGGAGGGTGGSLIKTGTGTLILTGAKTYTGGTTVNQGVLQLGTTGTVGTLSSSGTIGVNNGGTFQIVNIGNQIYGNTIANNMTNGVGGVGTVNINSSNLNILTGALTDGAAGQLALTLSGSGRTILANAGSTYSGATTITGGVLQIGTTPTGPNVPGSIGASSPVSVSGGGVLELDYVAGSVFANNVANGVGGTGTVRVSSTLGTITLSGSLTDGTSGQLGLTVNSETAILTNANNTYSGPTNVVGGASVLQIGTATKAGSVGGNIINVNSLGVLTLTNVAGNVFSNNVTNLATTGPYPDAEIHVTSSKTITVSGVWSDGPVGDLSFVQNGTGTTIFTGNNTYTGLTNIGSGRVVVNGTIVSTNVQVGYATLSGTGTLTGAVSDDGILAPGGVSTPGTLSVGSLALQNSDGLAIFRLGSPTGTNDLVNVAGHLDVTGSDLVIQPQAGFGVGTYTLFNYGGTLSSRGSNSLSPATNTLGYQLTVSTATPGKVQLVVSYLGVGQFWDGTGAANNGVVSGGSGSWTASASNWTTSTGSSNSNWQSGTAVFTGAAGTVTLGSPISAQALIFNTSGYTIAGTQTLTFTGSTPAINTANPSGVATITAPVVANVNLGFGGPGKVILANASDSFGGMTITTGTLQIGTATAAGGIGGSGKISIQQGGTLSLVNVSGAISNQIVGGDGGSTLNINSAGIVTLAGNIFENGLPDYGDSLSLTQTGSGTTILAGNNSYTGTTTVSNGTLQIGTATVSSSIGQDNTVHVGTGGTVSLVNNGSSTFSLNVVNDLGGIGTLIINSANTITLNGILSDGIGQLAFTQSGSGKTILNGTQAYTGATNITGGTLEVDGSLTAGSTVNVGTAGTLTGTGTINGNATVTGNGIINFGTGGNIAGTLGVTGGRWNGVGTVGDVVTASGAATNTFTINGTLNAPAGVNVTGGTIAGSGTLNGGLNYTSSSNSTFAGVIAGTSGLIMNGTGSTLILAGNNTYTGSTTVNGGTLQLGNGTTGSLVTTSVSVSNSGILATDLATNSTFSADVFLTNAASALNAIQPGINTLSGAIGGPGAFNQRGSGTTILNGANTYTGATTVSAGTLQVGDGNSGNVTGTSGVTVSGTGTLAINLADGDNLTQNIALNAAGTQLKAIGAGTNTLSGVISGTGAFNQNGSGTTVLTNAETYTGATNVIAGTLDLEGSLAAGSVVNVGTNGTLKGMGAIGGRVTLTGNGTINFGSDANIAGTLTVTGGNWSGQGTVTGLVTSSSGAFTINGNLTAPAGLNVTGGTLAGTGIIFSSLNYTSSASSTFAGSLQSSNGNLTMNKAGSTLTLTGTSNFPGAASVLAGTLQIGNGTSGLLTGISGITVSGTGMLVTDMADTTVFPYSITLGAAGTSVKAIQPGTNTLSGVISGSGSFVQNGTGTTALAATETYTGATNITTGTLEVDGSLSAASVVNVATGGTLSGSGTIKNKATITGNGVIDFVNSGNIVGTLTSTGGNWNGQGTVSGLVTASSGAFNINGNLTAPLGLNVTGGTLGGTGTLTGKLNYTSTASSTFGGTFAGSGSTITVNKAGGTLILTGDNAYPGATFVQAGTLQIGNGSIGSLTGTSSVTVTGSGILATDLVDGATFDRTVNLNAATATLKAIQAGTNTLTGIIGGTGIFNQNGTGTTILNKTETYTGATNVTTGTLEMDGTLSAASVVNVATGGTLTGSGTIKDKATITGNGVIQFVSGGNIVGTLTSTGGNWNGLGSVGGVVTASSGAFKINGNLTAPAGLNVTGGTLGGTGTLTGNLTYTSTTSSTFGGTLAGNTVTMNKAGATLTLTGNNTYIGTTSVQAGTLQIGNGSIGSLTGTSGVVVTGSGILATDLVDGGTFDRKVSLNAATATLKAIQAGTNTLTGIISGTGIFNQNGTGTTILNQTETYTGATNITTGTLQLDGTLSSASVLNIGTNGTLTGATTGTVSGRATLTGNGVADFDGHILGTLTVTGGNWDGSGTVNSLVTSSSGVFNLNGDLNATAGLAVTGGSLGGTGNLNGNLTYTSATSSTFGGTLGGNTVTMNKASSTFTLTGANTYAGGTTITAGTLTLGNGTVSGATLGTGNVTIGSGGTLGLNIRTGETFANSITDNGHITDVATSGLHTVSSKIIGTGNFTKTGGSVVALTGANTFTGGAIISGGTLLADNTSGSATGTGAVTINSGGVLGGSGTVSGAITLNSGGSIAPGAGTPGTGGTTLHATSLMWKAGGTLVLQLGPTGDELAMTGALTKSGVAGFILDLTDAGITAGTYPLLTFGSTNFAVSNFTLELPAGYTGSLIETATSLSVDVSTVVAASEEPEGAVIVASPSGGTLTVTRTIVPSGYLEPASGTFVAETVDSPGVTLVPTPEPGSATLLAFGGVAILGWRRRRRA